MHSLLHFAFTNEVLKTVLPLLQTCHVIMF